MTEYRKSREGPCATLADRLVLDPRIVPRKLYAHDVGSEIDNIFPALPGIFLKSAKKQRKRAMRVHELVRQREVRDQLITVALRR